MDCTVTAYQTWQKVWVGFVYCYPKFFHLLCGLFALSFSCLTSDLIASCSTSVAFTVFGRDTVFKLAAVAFRDCHGRPKLVRSAQENPAELVKRSSNLETLGEASSTNLWALLVCYSQLRGSWLKASQLVHYCSIGFHCCLSC